MVDGDECHSESQDGATTEASFSVQEVGALAEVTARDCRGLGERAARGGGGSGFQQRRQGPEPDRAGLLCSRSNTEAAIAGAAGRANSGR